MLHDSVPVVMYHHVAPVEGDLTVTPPMFEDHLKTLRERRWKTLSGDEFLGFMSSGEMPKKSVLLTFDDGFADNYVYAYPLLRKYKMKAVLFAATAFIDDTDISRDRFTPLPHREAWPLASTDRRAEVICTWNELREMEESGVFDVQSHGHSHDTPDLIRRRDYDSVRNDLLTGRTVLQERLSKEVRHFAWPRGFYDAQAIEVATAVGFRVLYTTQLGSNGSGDMTAVNRLPVKCKGGRWLAGRLLTYSSVLLSTLYLAIRRKT